MSALALVLHDLGHQVLGSDITQYTFTQKGLAAAGIKMLPFGPANLKSGYTVIAGNSLRTIILKSNGPRNWDSRFIVITRSWAAD